MRSGGNICIFRSSDEADAANSHANAVDESLAALLGKTLSLIYSIEQAIFPQGPPLTYPA